MANTPDKKETPTSIPAETKGEKRSLRDHLVGQVSDETSDLVKSLLLHYDISTSPTITSSLGSILTRPVYATGLTHSLLNLDAPSLEKQRRLESEIADLRRKIEDQAQALGKEKQTAKERERDVETLKGTVGELHQKERLGFLLNNVNQHGRRALLQSEEFQSRFLDPKDPHSFVMSIDIRRSTELMLKARSPEAFASFITNLCKDLMDIIMECFGVIDKFTGDGVLAYFPEFYSDKDAAFYALSAADSCHNAFKKHYQASRKSFKSILTDVGLGIGIDYGRVHLVQIAGGLTVVGEPVVFACRLSGAPAGLTYVNQPAYDEITDNFGRYCFATEKQLDIKHEGSILAYAINLNGKLYSPTVPEWIEEVLGKNEK